MRRSLLDDLSVRAGCDCLSELHTASAWRLYQILAELAPDDYPIEEWRDAAAYLDSSEKVETVEQARTILLKRLARKVVISDSSALGIF